MILTTLAVYCAMAFIFWDLSPLKWGMDGRFALVVSCATVGLILFVIKLSNNE